MDQSALEDQFFAHVPEVFLRNALRAIFSARRLAWDYCAAEYARTEAENVRPWVTRGKVEGMLRDVADLIEGVESRVVKAPKTNWNHTEVVAGPVLLTAGAVQTPCGPVDKADFRMGLARTNQQLLFEVDGDVERPIYAMLLHSGYKSLDADEREQYGHLPGSTYLAFPAADLDSYHHSINLFDRFPDVVKDNAPQEWEEEALVRYVRHARKSAWPAA